MNDKGPARTEQYKIFEYDNVDILMMIAMDYIWALQGPARTEQDKKKYEKCKKKN